jgi:hypothetical protein
MVGDVGRATVPESPNARAKQGVWLGG